jgi:hypothetical protein
MGGATRKARGDSEHARLDWQLHFGWRGLRFLGSGGTINGDLTAAEPLSPSHKRPQPTTTSTTTYIVAVHRDVP